MNNLFLALVDGAGKDLGSGGIIAIFSIVLVFLILGIIIAITYVVGLVIQKFANTTGIRDLEQAAEHMAANALYQIEVDHVDSVTFDAEAVKALFG